MRRLLIATTNRHKTAEIRAILGPEWEISDLGDHPNYVAPEETGATFLENATIKALAASRVNEGLVLADDSGLEVDALGGAPGVLSARYAGPSASDADNRSKLLRQLGAGQSSERRARFRCIIVLAQSASVLGSCSGNIDGEICDSERGDRAFGYDALFVPRGYDVTFGELPSRVKNLISHRALALAAMSRLLKTANGLP